MRYRSALTPALLFGILLKAGRGGGSSNSSTTLPLHAPTTMIDCLNH